MPTPETLTDYYALLGLDPGANAVTIRKAVVAQQRRWGARQNAPDLATRQEAERQTQVLALVRDVLLDPGKKALYDIQRVEALPNVPRVELNPPFTASSSVYSDRSRRLLAGIGVALTVVLCLGMLIVLATRASSVSLQRDPQVARAPTAARVLPAPAAAEVAPAPAAGLVAPASAAARVAAALAAGQVAPASTAARMAPASAAARMAPAPAAADVVPAPAAADVAPAPAAADVIAAPAAAVATAAAGVGGRGRAYVAFTDGEGVFLSSSPNRGDRLSLWPDGSPLEVVGDDVTVDGRPWAAVQTPAGQLGFVPRQYVSADAPTQPATPTRPAIAPRALPDEVPMTLSGLPLSSAGPPLATQPFSLAGGHYSIAWSAAGRQPCDFVITIADSFTPALVRTTLSNHVLNRIDGQPAQGQTSLNLTSGTYRLEAFSDSCTWILTLRAGSPG